MYISNEVKELVIKVLWYILFKMRLSTCFHCHHLPGQSHEISGSCSIRNALYWPCNSFCLRDNVRNLSEVVFFQFFLVFFGCVLFCFFTKVARDYCYWFCSEKVAHISNQIYRHAHSAQAAQYSMLGEFDRVPFTWIYYWDILSIRLCFRLDIVKLSIL